jgi:phytoene dehydrogenase-like protein
MSTLFCLIAQEKFGINHMSCGILSTYSYVLDSNCTENETTMKYDVIVIGSGIGGMSCAAKLAKEGKKVLLLEKNPHVGGTSYIFYRDGYGFPMGPMSFSFPHRVSNFLKDLGTKKKIDFERNHFQIVTPYFDIVYSLPFEEFNNELKMAFPEEKKTGIFLSKLAEIIDSTEGISSWHPDYLLGVRKKAVLESLDDDTRNKIHLIEGLSSTPCSELLDNYFSSQIIKNLLGSQGTHLPTMSILNLALMWNIMSFQGIWSPSCGIHGLTDLMREAFLSFGGELITKCPVKKIQIKAGKANGVICENGQVYEARWIVSNADYKKTFFELVEEEAVKKRFLSDIAKIPYTQSELCVYLGVDPDKVNLNAMRTSHLFYRRRYDPEIPSELEDFDNREIEICLWSANAPKLAPSQKAALVLRVGFPYDHFSGYWTGEKMRSPDYGPYKERLAQSLINTVEHILPGLSSAVEVTEIATPLTYQDWGQRYRGSLAGWTWGVKNEKSLGGKILVETLVSNLLLVGIFAASELFLGGIPTAFYTGNLAADFILEKGESHNGNNDSGLT